MLKKTGTFLGESARAHADLLGRAVMRHPVDRSALRSALQSPFASSGGTNPPHEGTPTELVDLKLDEDLASKLTREIVLKNRIEAGLAATVGGGKYSALSTQFENTILLLPSAWAFYEQNKDIVAKKFPEVETVVVNAFIVAPNERPTGVHNAGSLAHEFPELARQGLAYPAHHISFHTAITPTPLERQPLVVFEDAPAETPSLAYLYAQLRSFDLTPDEVDLIERCFALLITNRLPEVEVPNARNFLICKYWEKASGLKDCPGYYCEARPGQAVRFDNYRPHGDSTLPLSSESRITIDLRCFSKVTYPSEESEAGRFFLAYRRAKTEEKRRLLDCFMRIFGYGDSGDFLKRVFGARHAEVDILDVLSDLQVGFYNHTEHYVLDQDLSTHYEACEELFARIEREGEYRPPQDVLDGIAALKAS